MISTILADDEPLAREELAYQLRDFDDIEITATASNGLEAMKLIQDLEPDLVFLDVQMPGLDGMAVIRKLRDKGVPLPHFVMATAYDQYAVEAFRVEALDYLLKPVEKERLASAVERARRVLVEKSKPAPVEPPPLPRTAAPKPKLLLRTQQRNLIIDAADLVYATIDDGLITLAAAALEGESSFKTLEELQSSLDPEMFWRVHRSYLVNIHHIKEVIPWFKSSFKVRMNDKKHSEIPVSRGQTRRLRELFNL